MAALCSILKHGITLRASHFTLEWRINIYGEYFWNIGCTTAAAQQENPQATGNRNFERKNNLDCLLTSHGKKRKRHPVSAQNQESWPNQAHIRRKSCYTPKTSPRGERLLLHPKASPRGERLPPLLCWFNSPPQSMWD